MAARLRNLQCLIVIGVCLQAGFSYGVPCVTDWESEVRRPVDYGVKIVTYGEPCYTPRYLPVRIEEPVVPTVPDCEPTKPPYRPLKLIYQTVQPAPQPLPKQSEYPITVEVPPQVRPVDNFCPPDPLRGKSYVYSTQTPLQKQPLRILPSYNLDVQVLPPNPQPVPCAEKPVRYLKGLTSRIDRILMPACNNPTCSCKAYAA